MRYLSLLLGITILVLNGCNGDIQYDRWNVSAPLFSARHDHSLDNVAVKDPSIVYYQGKYHLFYTAKSKTNCGNKTKFSTGCAYASAGTLDKLNDAKRFNIDSIAGMPVIAPQIFYFEPHNLWYLIAHTPEVKGYLSALKPVYLTNTNIENVFGWSEAKEIKTGKSDDGFWIDFWVICDDQHAYLFYSGQNGSLFRLDCPLNAFPEGFSKSQPKIALSQQDADNSGSWKMFEAAHIYHVKKENRYLALLEGAYHHPVRTGDVDSRNRFIFGMTTDSLNGKWERIEFEKDEFLAEAKNLFSEDGSRSHYTQVSHPELIRSGFNQKLEIENFDLTMVFQSFDGSKIPDSYHYNELPWELALMKN